KVLAYENGGGIILWDLAAGRERAARIGPYKTDSPLRFNPNGTRLVAGSPDRKVQVWDTTTGKQLLLLRGHEGNIVDVGYSPDGRRIASGGDTDLTVRLWDAESGQSLGILSPHDGPVSQVILSRRGDGVLAVEASPGNALRLWDAATGKLLAVLRGHTNAAEKVAFSPDGARIAAGGLDRTIRLWDGRTGHALSSREG